MKVIGRTYETRRRLLDRVPAGLAVGIFEAAVAVGYLVSVIHVATNRLEYRQVSVALFPSGGLPEWLWFTGASCALTLAGLMLVAHRPVAGLQIERSGLLGLSASLVTYVFSVWDHTSGLSTAVETVGATLIACLFKVVTIGVALEGYDRRAQAGDRP